MLIKMGFKAILNCLFFCCLFDYDCMTSQWTNKMLNYYAEMLKGFELWDTTLEIVLLGDNTGRLRSQLRHWGVNRLGPPQRAVVIPTSKPTRKSRPGTFHPAQARSGQTNPKTKNPFVSFRLPYIKSKVDFGSILYFVMSDPRHVNIFR